MVEGLGKVHVITGPGKGKTTGAFGLAMRAAGHGLKVLIVQFMKTGGSTGEVLSAKKLKGILVEQFGTGRFVDSKRPTEDDRRCARAALERARRALESGECDVLVLDEVNPVVSLGLVSGDEVLKLLRNRRKGIEIILTGRGAPIEFVEYADYVSIIESKKHPFDHGLEARKGIEW